MTSGSIWRRLRVATLAAVAAPPVTVAMVVIHESGHTVMAWLMGDWGAYFVLYRNSPTDQCIGCNMYNSAAISPLANTVVNLGGVLFTALLTWGAIFFLARRTPGRFPPRWLLAEVAAIAFVGDLVWQVVQALPLGIPLREPIGSGLGYTDFSAAGSFFAQATGWPRSLVETLGIVAVSIYAVITTATLVHVVRQRTRTPTLEAVT